jgi:hypothetical protein
MTPERLAGIKARVDDPQRRLDGRPHGAALLPGGLPLLQALLEALSAQLRVPFDQQERSSQGSK